MKRVGGESWRSPCWVWQPRREGRNAAALSLPPLPTCGEDKAFLFHFHGFRRASWMIFVTSPGAHVGKSQGHSSCLISPHLTAEKGKLKSQELSGRYKYHRSYAESRSVGQKRKLMLYERAKNLYWILQDGSRSES